MNFDLKEAIDYYRRQGAPGDQNALRNLLAEVQEAHDGAIPGFLLPTIAEGLGTRESFLAALIRRIPSLRLAEIHTLEVCGGPNCGKHQELWALAEKLCAVRPDVKLTAVPCLRVCGKGPNLRWDGKLFHKADEELLRQLLEKE